jgi:transposase
MKVRHILTAAIKSTSKVSCHSSEVDPRAREVEVVLDNLSTHTPAALYKTFEPHEALRILSRLRFHYTPKHGSWLNMVEFEFSVLLRQCLNRQIPELDQLSQAGASWEAQRNDTQATVKWLFTVDDTRTKLARLYP